MIPSNGIVIPIFFNVRCRDVITVLGNTVRIIIRDKHPRSRLTGRDKTKRNPEKRQSERSVNQARRADTPDLGDAGGKTENHIMMRSRSSDGRWNGREWGDVMMRVQVTAGR